MLSVNARCSGLLLLAALPVAALAARPDPMHWERLPVARALPSQVFARLGIGHNTRRGYTRDGAKKGDPDPTFPLGLTDVVPLDTEHLLLARGTEAGLTAFKVQVAEAQAQMTTVRWHLVASLVRAKADPEAPAISIGPLAAQDAPDDTPVTFLLGPNGDRPYQVRVLPTAQGLLQIVWQRGLPLSRPVPSSPVLAPDVAWSAGVSRTIPQGGTATFDDLAADRVAARQALGLPPDALGGDYGIRLSVSALAPPAPSVPAFQPPTPVPVAPAAP